MKIKQKFILGMTSLCLFSTIVNAGEVKVVGNTLYSKEQYNVKDICKIDSNIQIASFKDYVYVFDLANVKFYQIDKAIQCSEITESVLRERKAIHQDIMYEWSGNIIYRTQRPPLREFYKLTKDTELKEKDYYNEYGTIIENPVKEDLATYYEPFYYTTPTEDFENYSKFYDVNEYGDIIEVGNVNKDNYLDYLIEVKEDFGKEEYINVEGIEFIYPKEKSGYEIDIVFTPYDLDSVMKINNEYYILFYAYKPEVNDEMFVLFKADGTLVTLDNFENIEYLTFNDNQDTGLIFTEGEKDKLYFINDQFEKLYEKEISDNRTVIQSLVNTKDTDIYLYEEVMGEQYLHVINKYKLLEGASQIFKGESLTFKFTGNVENLKKVYVNDIPVDDTKNFVIDSTIRSVVVKEN